MLDIQLWQIILGIVTMSVAATGSAVYVYRSGIAEVKTTATTLVNTVENQTKDHLDRVGASVHEIKDDFKRLHAHVDEKIESMYDAMDNRNTQLTERFDSQVRELKVAVKEVDTNISSLKDDIHLQDKSIMGLRLEVHEKFAKTDDLKRIESDLERIKMISGN